MTKPTLLGAVLALAVFASARADEPPADGTRYVRYGLRVDGLAKFPDRLLVAFPWTQSNNEPRREHTVIYDGALIEVGRRSPPVVLYDVSRVAWEAFMKRLPGDPKPREQALAAFLAGPDALRCEAAPTPIRTVPADDTRRTIDEIFVVKALDATQCVLEHPAAPAAAPRLTAGESGCGCGAGDDGAAPLWLVVAAILGLGRRRTLARTRT